MSIRREIPPMLHLALPLVLAEIGWMTMGIVDTVMVGHLPDSANAIGAVSISSSSAATRWLVQARRIRRPWFCAET